MESTMTQSITIKCNVKDLFNYVKQPWLWPECKNESILVPAMHQQLSVGDQFKEDIPFHLLSRFPLKIYQHPVYEVLEIFPNQKYVIQGKIQKTNICISYEFTPITDRRTKFKQTLTVKTKGTEKVLHPLLHFYFKHSSYKALNQLKQTCEIRF